MCNTPEQGSLGALDKPVQPVNNRLLSLLGHVSDYSAAELWRGWMRLGVLEAGPGSLLGRAQRSSARAPLIGHLALGARPGSSP